MGKRSLSYHIKVTNFFLTIAEWDRHIEVTRQFLNSIEDFEPYAAYLRLSAGTGSPLTAQSLADFLLANNFKVSYMGLKTLVRLFDTRMANSLDFEDFLKMILSRDNPDLRFNAVSTPNYEVNSGQSLSEEIEYTMARFLFKATEFLDRVAKDAEIRAVLADIGELFGNIDEDMTGVLEFGNLTRFFGKSRIRLRDQEIISILRVIDVNDDGKISLEEFGYFVCLFKGQEPGEELIGRLRVGVGERGEQVKVLRQKAMGGLERGEMCTLKKGERRVGEVKLCPDVARDVFEGKMSHAKQQQ
jgi:Ca2+-binding EF-hand superfamily protein